LSFRDPSTPVPAGLETDEFVLRPIVADDAAIDHAAVMESREYLRLWEQSAWPEDDFTVEANREDLLRMEERHAAHRAFTFAVLDPTGSQSLGCVYIFPTSATFLARSTVTRVADEEWAEVDAVAYFWVRRSRMETGLDARLLAALRDWFSTEWGLARTVYVTNEQFTAQVDLIAGTELRLLFELREPDKPGTYLAFG
jgi:RimJ/RimL family protein N-acetyltransferase